MKYPHRLLKKEYSINILGQFIHIIILNTEMLPNQHTIAKVIIPIYKASERQYN